MVRQTWAPLVLGCPFGPSHPAMGRQDASCDTGTSCDSTATTGESEEPEAAAFG